MGKNKQELAISVKKSEDMSKWYTEVIQKADLIEYTDVAGCMIFKPNSFQIWEVLRDDFDAKIKKSGVKNAYFPIFIPEKLLNKEEDHVEGFAPEVAWVTHAGDTKLKEKLAVRPTSETIMYDAYSKWINSYRDLPLRLNQWNSVVRWEFKHATPFLRNREFLWHEGHSAFATKKEADDEVREILEYYRETFEDLLAIPVNLGRKSVAEKFAGADYTLTAETFLQDGKGIQAATSHHLGQNFSKAFDISFLDKDQKKKYVWQNSWAFTTRTIGTMIMVHGDDKGLVLPPRVAVNKLVIIPLLFKGKEKPVLDAAKKLRDKLIEFNPILDRDEKESAGFKFNKWEIQGIPLRVEIGPRDVEEKKFVVVRRDAGGKTEIKLDDKKIAEKIQKFLDDMHRDMFEKAKKAMEGSTVEVDNIVDFRIAIKKGQRCLVPWAEDPKVEEEIKEKTGAKSSCLPFKHEKRSLKGVKCFYTNKPATCYAYFCKSH